MRNLQVICRPGSCGNSRVLADLAHSNSPTKECPGNFIGHPQPGCKEREPFGLNLGRRLDDSVAAIPYCD